MKKERTITVLRVDPILTRMKIAEQYGSVSEYARRTSMVASTLLRILSPTESSRLPHNPSIRSRYQEMLRKIKSDGLLVESPPRESREAA